MTLIHDIIKIKYSNLGYLPGYPYHMISDKEMFDAFIDLSVEEYSDEDEIPSGEYFFEDNYPNPFAGDNDLTYKQLNREGKAVTEVDLSSEYKKLRKYIVKVINAYLTYHNTELAANYTIPYWVYTYMLGEVVYNNSEYQDIYDTLALLGANNIDNQFTNKSCALCYATSYKYISKKTLGNRPLSVFGEPHVIKQLRLEA